MSGFLLDTNVISELIKPRPEPRVTTWIEETDESLLYLSVLTLGEIRRGIAALPKARRRTSLEAWLESDLRTRFHRRVLPIDEDVADRWGLLTAQAQTKGVVVPVIDGLRKGRLSKAISADGRLRELVKPVSGRAASRPDDCSICAGRRTLIIASLTMKTAERPVFLTRWRNCL